jgi:hypothetical protein
MRRKFLVFVVSILLCQIWFIFSVVQSQRIREDERVGYDDSPPSVVFVMGFHHSGTSIVTRCLIEGGMWGGPTSSFVLQGGDKAREGPGAFPLTLKFWEHRTWVRGHEEVAVECGEDQVLVQSLGWHTGVGVDVDRCLSNSSDVVAKVKRGLVDELRALRASAPSTEGAQPATLVVKEPRLSLFAPLSLDAAGESGEASPLCLLLLRHPLAVARGLRSRPPNRLISQAGWTMLWAAYTTAAVAACDERGIPITTLLHADLVQSMGPTLARLNTTLGGPLQHPVGQDFLDEFLPPFHPVPLEATDDDTMPPPVRAVWNAVRDGKTGPLVTLLRQEPRWREPRTWWDTLRAAEVAPRPGRPLRAIVDDEVCHAARAEANVGRPATVVLLLANAPFGDLARNALCSLRRAAPSRQTVAVSLDARACLAVDPILGNGDRCCASMPAAVGAGTGRLETFSTRPGSGYQQILAAKIDSMLTVLRAGRAVLLVDADIVFVQDPLPLLWQEADETGASLLVSSDARPNRPETSDWLCAGLMFARPHPAVLDLLEAVRLLMDRISLPDQDALQLLLTGHTQVATASVTLPPGTVANLSWSTLPVAAYENGRVLASDAATTLRQRPGLVSVHANQRLSPKKRGALERASLWFARGSDACVL